MSDQINSASEDSSNHVESTPIGSGSEVERRLAAIAGRFPERFSAEQIDKIRERVVKSIEFGAKLSEQHLPNSVGPHFDPRAMSHD